eukprot:7048398-Pyramimonas_sp.AAC.1
MDSASCSLKTGDIGHRGRLDRGHQGLGLLVLEELRELCQRARDILRLCVVAVDQGWVLDVEEGTPLWRFFL